MGSADKFRCFRAAKTLRGGLLFIDSAEVSVGFAVALVMNEVWPERDATTKKPGNDVRWRNTKNSNEKDALGIT